QGIIRQIEAETKTSLICYVAPPHLQIDRVDTVAMVDLLHNIAPGTPIDLLLHSPGAISTPRKSVS
ncbi:hypothetical protein ACFC1U_20870, partial [Bacillus subtilis]|uniref:hypothetical protein n=1 Tax=Bacillus subtilis TaxID=1423 RepID=UPI0035E1C2A7